MKYQITHSARFKRSYKRVSQQKNFKEAVFVKIVNTLASVEPLDSRYRDHQLTGNLKDFRECHLAPDILLIYKLEKGILILTLIDVGSHSQLFK